jgi:hypothetical protein
MYLLHRSVAAEISGEYIGRVDTPTFCHRRLHLKDITSRTTLRANLLEGAPIRFAKHQVGSGPKGPGPRKRRGGYIEKNVYRRYYSC